MKIHYRNSGLRIISKFMPFLILLFYQFIIAQDTLKTETKKECEKKKESICVIEIEPFSYCAVEMTGSYDQHGAAFGTLYQAAGTQSLDMTQIPFGVYYNNPNDTPEEELKWDIGFQVAEDTQLKEPLVLKKWEYTLLAKIGYEGNLL